MLVFSADQWLHIPSGRSLTAGPTQHFTIVFNVFVFMQVCGTGRRRVVLTVWQIFNEINARKVHDEINSFTGFFSNPLFVGIIVGTIAVQALIVEFGGQAFKVSGLTWDQWLICIVGSACNIALH